jgi:hypothetical protein
MQTETIAQHCVLTRLNLKGERSETDKMENSHA